MFRTLIVFTFSSSAHAFQQQDQCCGIASEQHSPDQIVDSDDDFDLDIDIPQDIHIDHCNGSIMCEIGKNISSIFSSSASNNNTREMPPLNNCMNGTCQAPPPQNETCAAMPKASMQGSCHNQCCAPPTTDNLHGNNVFHSNNCDSDSSDL